MGQRSHDLWGSKPTLELPQFLVPVPLCQPPAIRGQQQGDMAVLGMGQVQPLLEPDLPGVEESRSLPRTTWVTPISASSTTTAS